MATMATMATMAIQDDGPVDAAGGRRPGRRPAGAV
jgi:hypothetical protein